MFNQPIVLTPALEIFIVGGKFDKPIILVSGITRLAIGCDNYAIIDNLPNNMKSITLGYDFDLQLVNMSNNLVHIRYINRAYRNNHTFPCNLRGICTFV